MVENLGQEDYPDEADEEEDYGTGEPVAMCVKCEDGISLTEEVFLLTIAQPFMNYSDGIATLVLIERDQSGVPFEEPAFYDFACWENVKEEAQEACEDTPPVQSDNGLLCCDICESDILEGETMAIETFGEIQWSERCPNNLPTHAFVPMSDGKHICIACLAAIDTDHIRPNLLSYLSMAAGMPCQEICLSGIHSRCWRPESINEAPTSCTTCPNRK